jgi:hypothetical protein
MLWNFLGGVLGIITSKELKVKIKLANQSALLFSSYDTCLNCICQLLATNRGRPVEIAIPRNYTMNTL